MASSKETYCLCGQPYNIGQFMIECDCCREWFHGSCVNVKVYQSDDIDKYHCPKCVPTYGPSVFKIPTNSHRADRYEIGAESRPPQAGTPAWVRSLAEAPLRPTAAALQRLRPQQFTEEFVRDNGFTRPILFQTNDGLDMKIPNPATFTVRSVLRYVGAQHEVEVIDVRKQASVRMPLAEFVDYFETPPDHRDNRVLNILSLEISDTKLSALVEPPGALRSLDWTARVWAGDAAPRPLVQKYCLVSAAGAYTDFHLDFGGTTVWYHVLHGRKIFYLIPPTSTNLALYQQWCSSPTQSETYFADLVEWYGTAELCAGQTLFIPSGWIHAVLTPRDSLVFGGNLLHSYAIETQLQVYEIERRVETPLQFRYPLFETMNWYAAVHLLTTLRRHNEEIQDEEFTLSEVPSRTPAALPPLLLRGIKILASALKEWHALKASDPVKRDNVPKCLNSGQLVRELCKELRILEKRTANTASKDKDYKVKSTGSPNKTKKQQTPAKKSLKLTLPKPIMHMAQNGDFPDDKIYAEKFYIDDKEIYTQDRYTPQDLKYNNIDPKYIVDNTGKYIIENTKIIDNGKYIDSNIKFVDSNGKYVENSEKYMDTEGKYVDSNGKYIDSVDNNGKYMDTEAKYVDSNGKFVDADGKYVDPNGKYVDNNGKYMIDNGTKYVVDGDGKFVIDNKDIDDKGYVYQTFEEVQYQDGFVDRIDKKTTVLKMKLSGPPPPYPCESILKSQLAGRGRPPAHWTISARDHADHLLYTNDGPRPPQAHPPYGPGMYSAEDVPQDFQYSGSTKTGPYPTEYGFDQYYRYEEIPQEVHQPTPVAVGVPPVAAGAPPPQYTALPSYAAAVGQYAVPPAEDTYVPPPPAAAPPPGAPRVRRSCRASRRRVSASFDYEDTDLYIDVPPPPRQRHKQASTSESYRAAPANGIESLIQASELADGPADDDTGDNTSDAAAAVAGMLSIGGSVPHNATFGLPQPSTKSPGSSKRARKSVVSTKSASAGDSSADEETADVIREVHRDDEYVYPSLEMSSDEDEEWTASKKRKHSRSKLDRTKQERDESWSPRGRVGRLVPRVRCAPRPTRRECVRAALTHAAKREHTPTHNQNAKRAVIATKSKRPPPPPPPPVQPTPNNNKNNMRLKKGMKTAKQRLGKILKIHKMIY